MDIVVYGPLRSATGGRRVTVDVDGSTVEDALGAFVAAYPRAGGYLYADDGTVRPSVRVTADGERVELGDPCPADGELALFPAMQGG